MFKKSIKLALASFFAVLVIIGNSLACDLCGSAVTSSYLGILPQFKQHFIGVRHQLNSFESKPLASLSLGSGSNALSTDLLQRTEVWGRFYPVNRVQLFAFVPYQINTKTEVGISETTHGLSDISILANYLLINTGDTSRLSWKNTLSVGAGIKAPTGKFDKDGVPALQIGTGTWDYLFTTIYTSRYKKWGINIDANYRLNGANENYQFGNRISTSLRFFYWQKKRITSYIPNLGILAEHAEKDLKNNVIQKYTGGKGFYTSLGLDLYYKKISIGASFSLPISESLNENMVNTKYRTSLQAIYLF